MRLVKTLSIGADDQPSASYYIYELSEDEIENLNKQHDGIRYIVSIAKIEVFLVDPLKVIYTLYEYEANGVITFKTTAEECEQWARYHYVYRFKMDAMPFKLLNIEADNHQLKINFDTYEVEEEHSTEVKDQYPATGYPIAGTAAEYIYSRINKNKKEES